MRTGDVIGGVFRRLRSCCLPKAALGSASCHLGENAGHTMEPSEDACVTCHPDAEDFDIDGVQTEVQAMLDELQEALEGAGMLDEEGEPVLGTYPMAQAAALWDYLCISNDGSTGVHNPTYTKALLQAGLDAF